MYTNNIVSKIHQVKIEILRLKAELDKRDSLVIFQQLYFKVCELDQLEAEHRMMPRERVAGQRDVIYEIE